MIYDKNEQDDLKVYQKSVQSASCNAVNRPLSAAQMWQKPWGFHMCVVFMTPFRLDELHWLVLCII